MAIEDITVPGYVNRWTLVDGWPRCAEDPVPELSDAAVPALQRNAAVRAMDEEVAPVVAALAVVEQGEPDNGLPREIVHRVQGTAHKVVEDPEGHLIHVLDDNGDPISVPAVDAHGAPIMVDEIDPDGRPVMVPNPAFGPAPDDDPRMIAYKAAQAVVEAAGTTLAALARWRMGAPDAAQAALAELDRRAAIPLAVDPRPVPRVIPLWRAKVVLRVAGLLEAADAVVSSSGNPVLSTFWEYAPEIYRDSPTLAAMAQAINLTDEQLDDLFRKAAALSI